MKELNILPDEVAVKLAAGEVVERPASCLKEVVENSIDAKASLVDIKLLSGGIKKIDVYDNGKGIHSEDIEYVFNKHTTSKIKSVDDIFSIKTMGFRGEALCAISSVSKVTLISKHHTEKLGNMIKVEGGKVILKSEYPFEKGTKIIIEDLFFNTPARLKFLKSNSTEQRYCTEVVERLALCYPEISFRLEIDNKVQIFTPGDNKFESSILSIFGKEILNNLIDFSYDDNNIKINGFFVNPTISKSTRNGYYFYVNKRYVRSKILTSCVDEAFKNHIMSNRHPIIFLFVQVKPEDVDVNVHPAKLEVRFKDESYIYNSIYKTITKRLTTENMIVNKSTDSISNRSGIEFFDNSDFGEIFPIDNNNFNVYYDKNRIKSIENEDLCVKEQFEFDTKSKEQDVVQKYADSAIKDNENLRLVGYIFDTYIIVQKDEGIYLIDQHAVHERVLFNKLQSQLKQEKIAKQVLLPPVILDLPFSQKSFVIKNKEIFDKIGFEIDEFGKNEILIRTIPTILQEYIDDNFLFDVFDSLYNESQKQGIVDFTDEFLKDIACKMAVKGKRPISDFEKLEIIKKVMIEKEIFNCPHGRPVVVKIEKKEIEKMFKRIL